MINHNWDYMYAYSLPVGLRLFYANLIVERMNAEREESNAAARISAQTQS